jgi:hypothetical protein
MNRIYLLCFFMAVSALDAHQDTIIRFVGYSLEGLPENYQPATFVIEKKRIKIGANAVTIPECLWKYLEPSEKKKIRITSSWYHSSESLPPYINFSVVESNTDNRFGLVLNLNTLEIIFFEKETKTSDTSSFYERIPLPNSCTDSWIIEKY